MTKEESPIRRRYRRTSILIEEEQNLTELRDHYEDENADGQNPVEEEDEDDDDDKYAKYTRQQRRRSSSDSISKRAFQSFRHTAALSLKSNRVDAFLAAFGCAASLALLQWLSLTFPGYEVMSSCLVSSSIKFFFNESPPSLEAFWKSSIFALLAGITLHFVPTTCGKYARPILLFVTVLYWKLQGGLWSAANTLSMTMAVESGGWFAVIPPTLIPYLALLNNNTQEQPEFPWRFLLLPYLTGHLILYVLACLLSLIRRRVRVYLIRQEFISKEIVVGFRAKIVSGKERRKRLWNLFHRMNTSGDGQLDAVELQVALRAATGTDISIADANAMIRCVDSDGNGTVDFDEFCASIEKLWAG